jgi:hypothetical protein
MPMAMSTNNTDTQTVTTACKAFIVGASGVP